MEANGGGHGPEDYEIAMVVSARGLVAWVPAQAVAQNGGRDALAAAVRQNAWVPAEAAARTGWIPPAGMLVVEEHHALAVALGHGWVQGKGAAAENALYLAFLYLPAQEVVRCRRICRLWRAVADTDEFRLRHHDHRSRTPMPLFLFQDRHRARYNLRAIDIQSRVSRPVIRFNRDHNHEVVMIHGSCAGIVLISFGDTLYASNPCTRRFARLPELHVANHIIGFYATTGRAGFRCKVLYHDRDESGCAYWIYTLGTLPSAARCIGRALDPVLAGGVAFSHDLPPVLFLNFLHWLNTDNNDILRFNTVAETFSMIAPPSIRRGNQNYPVRGRGRQLFEIDKHLAMTIKCLATARVGVWVLSKTTGLWSCRYYIRLPVGKINLNGSSHNNISVFAVAQDRNVLVCCPHILLQCDALGTELRRYQLPGHLTLLVGHAIQGSLLLHPSILHHRF
ncbi:unnamed protein product [Alopecurus aequalis]